MLKFFLTFLLILAGLYTAEMTQAAKIGLVLPWNSLLAKMSAHLIMWFDPNVTFYANIIQSTANGFGVAILSGCNAVEACIVLSAAILAFPASWRHKLRGLVLGMLAVQGVNIVRIISLFYLGQWRTEAFDFAHLYLWQALIMLDVLVVWLIWVRAIPTSKVQQHAA